MYKEHRDEIYCSIVNTNSKFNCDTYAVITIDIRQACTISLSYLNK